MLNETSATGEHATESENERKSFNTVTFCACTIVDSGRVQLVHGGILKAHVCLRFCVNLLSHSGLLYMRRYMHAACNRPEKILFFFIFLSKNELTWSYVEHFVGVI